MTFDEFERFGFYMLDDDRNVIRCKTIADLARSHVRVGYERIGDVHISTVFLGVNVGRFGDAPLFFETMIFGGEHDEYQERCATWVEAEAQHKKAVELVRRSRFKAGGCMTLIHDPGNT